jgi:Tol biopolymer transport system component
MNSLKILVLALFAVMLLLPLLITRVVYSQTGTEAPSGFDNLTNDFEDQPSFDADRQSFENQDKIADGLGPVYNAQSCAECHQNPVTGGISQITELRAGRNDANGHFIEAPGGSLIQSRAINPKIQERTPDTGQLVFGAIRNGSTQNVVTNDEGSSQFVLNVNSNLDASWAPDGTKILFSLGHSIRMMNPDGTNTTTVITVQGFPYYPVWQPLPGGGNGKIALTIYDSTYSNSNIYTMDANGNNLIQITNNVHNSDHLAWSPDGTKIAFQSDLGEYRNIYVVNADGSNQTNLTHNDGTDVTPAWSPDGTKIVFASLRANANISQLFVMNANGTNPVQLTNNSLYHQYPTWSPDGAKIAFDGISPDNHRDIYVMDSDGTHETKITNSATGVSVAPSWSPILPSNVRTFRTSLNTLGDGFVEAIDDSTIINFAVTQPAQDPNIHGQYIMVPLLEAAGVTRVGRFGWKDSLASLLSFSATAYQAEIGITSPLRMNEQTSLGRPVAAFDTVAEPEDPGGPQGFGADVEAFTRFMRASKAPPRDRELVPDDASDPGSQLFGVNPNNSTQRGLGCVICHVRDVTTAPAGTSFNGGTFTVPAALGGKTIHPFSDFLLHDVVTGDGIVETNGDATKNKLRTAPLWGVRTRDRLMHDGGGSSSPPTNNGVSSLTLNEAILRHAGEAANAINSYRALSPVQKSQLIRFLKSL